MEPARLVAMRRPWRSTSGGSGIKSLSPLRLMTCPCTSATRTPPVRLTPVPEPSAAPFPPVNRKSKHALAVPCPRVLLRQRNIDFSPPVPRNCIPSQPLAERDCGGKVPLLRLPRSFPHNRAGIGPGTLRVFCYPGFTVVARQSNALPSRTGRPEHFPAATRPRPHHWLPTGCTGLAGQVPSSHIKPPCRRPVDSPARRALESWATGDPGRIPDARRLSVSAFRLSVTRAT